MTNVIQFPTPPRQQALEAVRLIVYSNPTDEKVLDLIDKVKPIIAEIQELDHTMISDSATFSRLQTASFLMQRSIREKYEQRRKFLNQRIWERRYDR